MIRRFGIAMPLAACVAVPSFLIASTASATPVLASPTTSVPSPQPLGTSVLIKAAATDTDPGVISYRYQIGAVGGTALSMVRDYSVDGSFTYTPTRQEGSVKIVITARNNTTGDTAQRVISPFTFTSLVINGQPAATATANALVALFSSPPCPAGAVESRARFMPAGSSTPSYTNWSACAAGRNINLLIAGMLANTTYTINIETSNGSVIGNGQPVSFTTGVVPVKLPPTKVTSGLTGQDNQSERILLLSPLGTRPFAVNLAGQTIWYYPDPSNSYQGLYRTIPGGNMLLTAKGANSTGVTAQNQQILREIDVAGNTLRETNASRVSEQVAAMSGIASECALGGTDCLVGAFHHEAIRLANGHTVILSDEEKIFTDGTQGSSPTNPVDVMGDIIVDLDANWQVAWYWRAFDWLDANRAAILGEVCPNSNGGCPPIFLTKGEAQDWLHGNALYYTAQDGSLLFSMRHQDWIDKIDYGNGTGTGSVLWTLGADGDFTIDSSDPYPWFSHQHDPGFVLNGTTTLALFDNGDTRVSPPPLGLGFGDSRGYVLTLDQVNKVATPILLADLGIYSQALGTAELLSGGDYHFDAGISPTSPIYAQAIEVSPEGFLSYTLREEGFRSYRIFRLQSLYVVPDKD